MADGYGASKRAGTAHIVNCAGNEDAVVEMLRKRVDALETELQASRKEVRAQKEELDSRIIELSLISEKLESTSMHLQEIDEQYRNIVDSITEGVWVADADSGTIFVNRPMADMLGYAPDEMIGKRLDDFMDEGSSTLARLKLERLRQGVRESYEHRLVRKDGIPLRVISDVTPLKGRDGLFYGFIGIITDITGRKQAEEALRDARDEAELYLDLMAHDIKNMHQIAMGYLELAREIMELDDSQRALIDMPYGVLQKGSRLIENVRKLQRARSGNMKERIINLDEVLADVMSQYDGLPCRVIKCFNGGEPHYVKANDLLQDVFLNLIGNAIKHSNGNLVKIFVDLGVVRNNGINYYCISVADNGPGIPSDAKDRIFNRLQRNDKKAKGIGIGLHLVRSLVRSYNGRVWVEDRVSGDYRKGSRFVVMLPAADCCRSCD